MKEQTDQTQAKVTKAHERACYWLAILNQCIENGNHRKYDEANRKSQYWLDRLNKLEGLSE